MRAAFGKAPRSTTLNVDTLNVQRYVAYLESRPNARRVREDSAEYDVER